MDDERYDDPLGPLAYPEHRREATLLRLHGWDVWWEQNELDELWRLEYEPPKDVDERIAAIKFGSTWGEGRYGVLHRSTYPGVEWQLSRFDQYGPWGHGEHDTIAEAVKDGKRHYGFYVEEIVEMNPHLPIWLQKQPKVVKGQADTYASTDGRVEIVNTRRVVIRDPGGGKRRVRMWALTVDRVEHGEYESLEDAFEALLETDYEVPSEGKKRKRAKMKPRKKRPVPAPVKEPTRARSARPRQPSKPAQATARRPALEALTGMGWKRREAEAAVDAVLADRPQAPTELVVRRAMTEMAHKRSGLGPSSADIMATRLRPRPTEAKPPEEPKPRFTAKQLNEVVKRTLKKYPGLIVTNVSLDDRYELRFDVQNSASTEASPPALSVSLNDELLFATQVYEETKGESWEFDVKTERALGRAIAKAVRESLKWMNWTKATKAKASDESLERPWSRPKPAARPAAKRSRPTRHARREAAVAAGVEVCPSAVYEMFGSLAPVFSTDREQSPYWQERYDIVLQMFPSMPLVEVDEDGDETHADAIDWWTTDLLTEPQRRRLHRAVVGRRFGSVVRSLRDAKRIADKLLKSKPGTKKRDDLQRRLETAEGRYRQEIDGMVELFEADTAEEDWLSERAAADAEVSSFGPGVGEAWKTVDFCARELVYGTADRRAVAAADIAAMRQGALFGASPRRERSTPPATIVRIPVGFYAQEEKAGFEVPRATKRTSRSIFIDLDDPNTDHLLHRARARATVAARKTVSQIEDAYRETGRAPPGALTLSGRFEGEEEDDEIELDAPVGAPGKDPNHPWWDSVDDPGFARGPAGEVYKVHVGFGSPSFGPGRTSPSFGRILRADDMQLEVEPERDRKLGPPWRVRIWPAPWHGTYHQISERGWNAVEERFDTWEDAVAGMRRLALLPWQYLPGGDLESALVLAQAESPNATAGEQQGVAELIVRSHEPLDDPESTSDHPRASRHTEELLANMIEAQELYAYALHPTRTQSERAEAEERLRELLTKRDQRISGSSSDMSWPYQTALLQFAQWKRGMRDAPVLDEEEQPKKKRKKASRKKAPPRVKKPKSNPRARAQRREARLRDPEAGRQGMTTAQLLRKMGI